MSSNPPGNLHLSLVSSYSTNGYVSVGVSIMQINNKVCSFTVNGSNGLQILDYSSQSTPSLLSDFSTGNAISVQTANINHTPFAFVSCGNQELYIIKVSNPSSPTLDTIINFSGDAVLCSSIDTLNKRLFVGTANGLMYIYNASNLPSPVTYLGTYTALSVVNSIEVVNSLAYLAEGQIGMEIVSVVNPSNPAFISGFPANGLVYNDIKTYLNKAYAAAGEKLLIFDVSDSHNPQLIASYQNGSANFYSIALNASKVLCAEGTNGVEIVDFATPTTPLQIGYYKTKNFASDIFYYNGEIFVADGTDGILLLKYN